MNAKRKDIEFVIQMMETKRRLSIFTTILASIFAIVIAASWVRSYSIYDHPSCGFTSGNVGCNWRSYDASSHFPIWPPRMPAGASQAVLIAHGKILFKQTLYSEGSLQETAQGSSDWSSDKNAIPRFSYLYSVKNDRTHDGNWTLLQVTVQHWALLLFPVLIALLSARRWRVLSRKMQSMGLKE